MKSSDRAPLARTWSKSLSIRYKLWTWFASMPQLASRLQISEAFALLSQWLAQRSHVHARVKPPRGFTQWDVTPLFTCSSPVADEGGIEGPRAKADRAKWGIFEPPLTFKFRCLQQRKSSLFLPVLHEVSIYLEFSGR